MTVEEREQEFSLVLAGIDDLSDEVLDAFYEAGCDDATFAVRSGVVYATFARQAASAKQAILSAIRNIVQAGVGASVLRIDDCGLVTQAEIGRKIERSRQMVHQYATGQRGPGGFPPPVCHIAEGHPLYQWCEVASWLRQNNMLSDEDYQDAQLVEAINVALEYRRQHETAPELLQEILGALAMPA